MNARAHRGVGKSDELDARRIARSVLPLNEQQLRRPRLNYGIRAALRVLVSVRNSMTGERTRAVNALPSLVRANELDLDARKALNGVPLAEVSRWRAREEELALSIARAGAIRLAKLIDGLESELKSNNKHITELVEISESAALLKAKECGTS